MEYKHYIKIAEDLIITENFTVQDFQQSSIYDNQDLSVCFWVKNCYIDKLPFTVGLYFKENFINQIRLYCTDIYIKTEEERNEFNKLMILKHPEWGNAESILNDREQFFAITINFEE
jgi:hypothetical protein